MDLNILGLTYFRIVKQTALALFSFNIKIINLTFPIKICINFDTQIFYTFCGI